MGDEHGRAEEEVWGKRTDAGGNAAQIWGGEKEKAPPIRIKVCEEVGEGEEPRRRSVEEAVGARGEIAPMRASVKKCWPTAVRWVKLRQ